MTDACPIPSPDQSRFRDIEAEIKRVMLRQVFAALHDATETARMRIRDSGIDIPPPSSGYFAALIHQAMFCTLCGADPDTLKGGDPQIALGVLRNGRNIARHHWSSAIEPSS